MPKTMEELDDKLCNFCPIPQEARGVYGTPNGPVSCEGSKCGEAYENYLEEIAEGLIDEEDEDA